MPPGQRALSHWLSVLWLWWRGSRVLGIHAGCLWPLKICTPGSSFLVQICLHTASRQVALQSFTLVYSSTLSVCHDMKVSSVQKNNKKNNNRSNNRRKKKERTWLLLLPVKLLLGSIVPLQSCVCSSGSD